MFALFCMWLATVRAEQPAAPAAPVPVARLDLNRATAEQFAAISGVDPDTARRIVELRATRGSLHSVEELRVLRLDDEVLSTLRTGTSVQVGVPADPVMAFDTPEQVLAQFQGEPTIQQVHAWANDYANTSPLQVQRWLTQSVTFATLPEVTLEYRLQNDYDQGFEYQNADGADPVAGDQVVAVSEDADQGQTQYYTVRLNWELDRLIMSSEKIRVINEAQDIVKLRDKVLAEATRLYFERRRLQVDRLLMPKTDVMARVKDELRLLELTANLDAITGGAFSGGLGSR
jgi:hypothetical protein